MSLASPTFLLALLVLPLAFLVMRAARGRRRAHAMRFPAAATVAAVASTSPSWRRRLPAALLALAAVALIVALAEPQRTVAVPVEQARVMLVTDASGSMAATDVKPTRLDAARAAGKTFLDKVPASLRVGAVGFSSLPYAVVAPTIDREQVTVTLDDLQAGGGTGTGDAVVAALEALKPKQRLAGRRRPPAAIVLLSDGKATNGRDPRDAARQAAKLHVPIYTVALGTPDGFVLDELGQPVPAPPDPETLREMSSITGGEAFTAENLGALKQVYQRLGRQIGTRHAEKPMVAGFAAAGLLLLLLGAGAGVRWRGWV